MRPRQKIIDNLQCAQKADRSSLTRSRAKSQRVKDLALGMLAGEKKFSFPKIGFEEEESAPVYDPRMDTITTNTLTVSSTSSTSGGWITISADDTIGTATPTFHSPCYAPPFNHDVTRGVDY